MKKLISIVLGLLLLVCPFAVQGEEDELMPKDEIVEAPLIDPMSEEAINYLLGEDMYQGTLSWQGNKVSTKFNYDKTKGKR